MEYPGKNIEKLYELPAYTLPGEENVKAEKNWAPASLSSTKLCISWTVLAIMMG